MYLESHQYRKLVIFAGLVIASLIFSGYGFSGYAAKITKWVDDNGNIHYGTNPPASAQASEIKKPASVRAPARPTTDEVVLYSTSWCGYCKKARAYLRSQNISYVEKDIEKDRFAKRDYDRLGGRGVPFLVRGNRDVLRGFSKRRYRRFFAID